MLKDHLAKYCFAGNYNCAEPVLRAGNDYYTLELHDRDMKSVGATAEARRREIHAARF